MLSYNGGCRTGSAGVTGEGHHRKTKEWSRNEVRTVYWRTRNKV